MTPLEMSAMLGTPETNTRTELSTPEDERTVTTESAAISEGTAMRASTTTDPSESDKVISEAVTP
jgi:hypothetical protein